MALKLARRLIAVDEYHKMIDAGILKEDDRVELINGEILEMSPIGSEHTACVKRINALFSNALGGKAIIGVQDPVIIPENSEPQPDISILKYKEDFYASAHPTPNDIILLIEVAGTFLEFDQKIKLSLYAKAGIPEFWIINLEKNEIEVYYNPVGDNYKTRELFKPGEKVKIQSLELEVNVKDLLG